MHRFTLARLITTARVHAEHFLKLAAKIGDKLWALVLRFGRTIEDLARCPCHVQNETGEAIPAGSVVEMEWGPEGWRALRVLPEGEARPARQRPQRIRGTVKPCPECYIDGRRAVLVEDDWDKTRYGAIIPFGWPMPKPGTTVRIARDDASGRYLIVEIRGVDGLPLYMATPDRTGEWFKRLRDGAWPDVRPEAPAPATGFLGQLWEPCPATDEHGGEPRATVIELRSLGFREARNPLGVELPEGTRVRVLPEPSGSIPPYRIASVESYPSADPSPLPPTRQAVYPPFVGLVDNDVPGPNGSARWARVLATDYGAVFDGLTVVALFDGDGPLPRGSRVRVEFQDGEEGEPGEYVVAEVLDVPPALATARVVEAEAPALPSHGPVDVLALPSPNGFTIHGNGGQTLGEFVGPKAEH